MEIITITKWIFPISIFVIIILLKILSKNHWQKYYNIIDIIGTFFLYVGIVLPLIIMIIKFYL